MSQHPLRPEWVSVLPAALLHCGCCSTFIQVLSLFSVKFLGQKAWARSSVVEGMPRTWEARGSSLSTAEQKKEVRKTEFPALILPSLFSFSSYFFPVLSHRARDQSASQGLLGEEEGVEGVHRESCLVGRGEESRKELGLRKVSSPVA